MRGVLIVVLLALLVAGLAFAQEAEKPEGNKPAQPGQEEKPGTEKPVQPEKPEVDKPKAEGEQPKENEPEEDEEDKGEDDGPSDAEIDTAFEILYTYGCFLHGEPSTNVSGPAGKGKYKVYTILTEAIVGWSPPWSGNRTETPEQKEKGVDQACSSAFVDAASAGTTKCVSGLKGHVISQMPMSEERNGTSCKVKVNTGCRVIDK